MSAGRAARGPYVPGYTLTGVSRITWALFALRVTHGRDAWGMLFGFGFEIQRSRLKVQGFKV